MTNSGKVDVYRICGKWASGKAMYDIRRHVIRMTLLTTRETPTKPDSMGCNHRNTFIKVINREA